MARKNIKSALGASIKAEEKAVQSRFERAEAVLGTSPRKKTAPAPRKRQSPAKDQISNGRVIRDSFTTPADDYGLIAQIKQRCLKAGVSVNKSEVLRAGLHALETMSDKELLKVVERLAKVKTGRPAGTV